MGKKIKLFIDFDSTIVESVKAYCDVYNELYNANADYTKVERWDLGDQCPLAVDYVENIFATERFFEVLELIDSDTKQVLDELKEHYEVIIHSIGNPENISRKAEWIKRNLHISDMILLSKSNIVMDKSIIDMSGGIIVDDYENNLFKSNADVKICFGKETKEWNKNWTGIKVGSWKELGEILL